MRTVVSGAEVKLVAGGSETGTCESECLNTVKSIIVAGEDFIWELEGVYEAKDILVCHAVPA